MRDSHAIKRAYQGMDERVNLENNNIAVSRSCFLAKYSPSFLFGGEV